MKHAMTLFTAWGCAVVLVSVVFASGCNEAKTPEENVLMLIGKASGIFGCQGCAPEEGEPEGEPEGEKPEGEPEGEEPEGEEPEGEPEGEGEGEEHIIMLPGDVPLAMVRIPAGTYMRGRYPGEQDSYSSEDPQHEVTLTQDFYLGKYVVTKGQWQAVMGTTPWSEHSNVLDDPNSPAVTVSWNDAQAFITALNAHITGTGQGPASFRLPTEAEWEYAARAGTTTRFYWGDDPDYTQIDDYAWYSGNARDGGNRYAHVVGLKLPNAFGLYDMGGNVWEWCQDWYGSYPSGSVMDPTGPTSGSFRCGRGGHWGSSAGNCRSAYRYFEHPTICYNDIGFRLAR